MIYTTECLLIWILATYYIVQTAYDELLMARSHTHTHTFVIEDSL
jgi:hypothetical protein